ncbi:MAG: polysaccharide deacetylase family protein [Flavobacteriales bacterium]
MRYTGLRWLLHKRKPVDSVSVFSLHRVTNEPDYFFEPVRPDFFENFVLYLKQNYDMVLFSEIQHKGSRPKAILSFDDGYRDFLEHALPILMKYNVPCNLNLVNDCLNGTEIIWTQKLNDLFKYFKEHAIYEDDTLKKLGLSYGLCDNNWRSYHYQFYMKLLHLKGQDRNALLTNLGLRYSVNSNCKMLTWEDVTYCIKNHKVEIGTHTYGHESLVTLSSDSEFDSQIKKSITEFKDKLGIDVKILAFPNGAYNGDVIEYASHIGLTYLLKVDGRLNSCKNLKPAGNVISRINVVNESMDEAVLRAELFHGIFKSKNG